MVVPFCNPTAVEEAPHSCPQLPSQFCQNDQPFTFCQFDTREGFYYHSIHCKLFEHSLNIVSLNIFKEHLLIFCELSVHVFAHCSKVFGYIPSVLDSLYIRNINPLSLIYIQIFSSSVLFSFGLCLWCGFVKRKEIFFIFMLSNFSFIAP